MPAIGEIDFGHLSKVGLFVNNQQNWFRKQRKIYTKHLLVSSINRIHHTIYNTIYHSILWINDLCLERSIVGRQMICISLKLKVYPETLWLLWFALSKRLSFISKLNEWFSWCGLSSTELFCYYLQQQYRLGIRKIQFRCWLIEFHFAEHSFEIQFQAFLQNWIPNIDSNTTDFCGENGNIENVSRLLNLSLWEFIFWNSIYHVFRGCVNFYSIMQNNLKVSANHATKYKCVDQIYVGIDFGFGFASLTHFTKNCRVFCNLQRLIILFGLIDSKLM